MTVIARFEVIPVREGSMSTAIANALRALDRHPVSYETTATDTIIEADTVEEVFAAVQAAHQAIPDDRVITSVEIDEDRRRPQTMHQRVASVERELGYPPQRHEPAPPAGGAGGQMAAPAGQQRGGQPGQSTGQFRQSTGQPSGQPAGGQRSAARQHTSTGPLPQSSPQPGGPAGGQPTR